MNFEIDPDEIERAYNDLVLPDFPAIEDDGSAEYAELCRCASAGSAGSSLSAMRSALDKALSISHPNSSTVIAFIWCRIMELIMNELKQATAAADQRRIAAWHEELRREWQRFKDWLKSLHDATPTTPAPHPQSEDPKV